MTNLTKIAAIVLTALAASTSLASAGGGIGGIGGGIVQLPKFPQLPQPKPKIPFIPVVLNLGVNGGANVHHKDALPSVDCDVLTTVATTDDLWIVNVGNVELPAGTRLHYSVPSTGDRGAFLLPHSIEVGEKLKVSDVLHGATTGAPCAVKVLM